MERTKEPSAETNYGAYLKHGYGYRRPAKACDEHGFSWTTQQMCESSRTALNFPLPS